MIKDIINDIFPKKGEYFKMRLKENGKTDLIIINNQLICFKYYKSYIPSLWLLH